MSKKQSKDQKRKRRAGAKQHRKKEASARSKHTVLHGLVENRQCVLDLEICHPHRDGAEVIGIQAIVDTGATSVTIKKDLAQRLGLPVIGTTECATANGTMNAPVVLLKMIVSDHNTSASRVVQAIVTENQPDDMLFGIDAMVGGVLTVDMNKMKWEWRLTNKTNR